MDNCFLFDWLTVSFQGLSFGDCISLLGMNHKTWEDQKTGSRMRYAHRLAYDGISIHYTEDGDTKHQAGCCIEMSGQGCRDFETFGSGDWSGLFEEIQFLGGNITRLDIAVDVRKHSLFIILYVFSGMYAKHLCSQEEFLPPRRSDRARFVTVRCFALIFQVVIENTTEDLTQIADRLKLLDETPSAPLAQLYFTSNPLFEFIPRPTLGTLVIEPHREIAFPRSMIHS